MTTVFMFPGQGSQQIGMGQDLFRLFPEETAFADAILGYSIEELCARDPAHQLNQTQFTQPALFVVTALEYLRAVSERGLRPDVAAGHSLGEYAALFAAGAFDFITGLRLVQKRGEVMGRAKGGAMAAIIGLPVDRIRRELAHHGLDDVDLANLNAPTQIVISGPEASVDRAKAVFEAAGATNVVRLRVSAAFHSRYVQAARDEFAAFLEDIDFSALDVPVIANATGAPYEEDRLRETLADQITHSVRWTDTVNWLLRQPAPEFHEIGPGHVLTGLLHDAQRAASVVP